MSRSKVERQGAATLVGVALWVAFPLGLSGCSPRDEAPDKTGGVVRGSATRVSDAAKLAQGCDVSEGLQTPLLSISAATGEVLDIQVTVESVEKRGDSDTPLDAFDHQSASFWCGPTFTVATLPHTVNDGELSSCFVPVEKDPPVSIQSIDPLKLPMPEACTCAGCSCPGLVLEHGFEMRAQVVHPGLLHLHKPASCGGPDDFVWSLLEVK